MVSTNAINQLTKEILYCKQDIKYNKRNIVQIVNHKDFLLIQRKLFQGSKSLDVRNLDPISRKMLNG